MQIGSYYVFNPGQVYPEPHYDDGRYHFYSGLGLFDSGCGCGALGAAAAGVQFNASQVWAGWLSCKGCPPVCSKCRDAADTIRASLGQLGYGQLEMGVPWGDADMSAYRSWQQDNGLSPSGGWPAQPHMAVMEQQISAGTVTGSQEPVEYTKVGAEYVAPAEGVARAGIGGLMLLGVVGLAAVGGLALLARSRKKTRKAA